MSSSAAAKVATLPPVSELFAAFLGGVGPITSLAFVLTLGEVARFKRSYLD